MSTWRTLMGTYPPDGSMRVRLARAGYSALDAGTPPEQLAFDSSWPDIGQILLQGVVFVSKVGANHILSIETGIYYGGVPPLCLWQEVQGANLYRQNEVWADPNGNLGQLNYQCPACWTNGGTINFHRIWGDWARDWTCAYTILRPLG